MKIQSNKSVYDDAFSGSDRNLTKNAGLLNKVREPDPDKNETDNEDDPGLNHDEEDDLSLNIENDDEIDK